MAITEEGVPGGVDLQKAQAAYAAVVAAFGENSTDAQEMAEKVNKIKQDRWLAKPMSVQVKIAERKVLHKKRLWGNAKTAVESAEEAIRVAQRRLEEARERVVLTAENLQQAQSEVEALYKKASGEEDYLSMFGGLDTELEGDAEGLQALQILKAKMAQAKNVKEASVVQQVRAAEDVVELQRQAVEAQKVAIWAEERVREAKQMELGGISACSNERTSARVAPYA